MATSCKHINHLSMCWFHKFSATNLPYVYIMEWNGMECNASKYNMFYILMSLMLHIHLLLEQANAAEFPRDFLGISLPEQPSKYYFVLRGQRLVLEADSTIQTIMEKLQSYKTRVALNFEVCNFTSLLSSFYQIYCVSATCSHTTRGFIHICF